MKLVICTGLLLVACGGRKEPERQPAVAPADAAPHVAPAAVVTIDAASVAGESECTHLLTSEEVVKACGVAGEVRVEKNEFDGVPLCSYSLVAASDEVILGSVMHAVVRRFPSADMARKTYPLDMRAPHIQVVRGLGDEAIYYVTKDVLSPETLAFRRGPLSGFVETTERRCSREGMEAVVRTLLGRLQDDAGPPSRSASPPPR